MDPINYKKKQADILVNLLSSRKYEDVIRKQFVLPIGLKELDVYLQLHDGENQSQRKTAFRFPRGPDRRMPLDRSWQPRPHDRTRHRQRLDRSFRRYRFRVQRRLRRRNRHR